MAPPRPAAKGRSPPPGRVAPQNIKSRVVLTGPAAPTQEQDGLTRPSKRRRSQVSILNIHDQRTRIHILQLRPLVHRVFRTSDAEPCGTALPHVTTTTRERDEGAENPDGIVGERCVSSVVASASARLWQHQFSPHQIRSATATHNEGIRKMLRATVVLIIIVLTATMSACVLDPVGDQAKEARGDVLERDEVENQTAPTGDATTEEASSVSSALTASCSVVEFCNVPNSSEGTRCIQQGCGIQTAVKECKTETANICGTPVNTWIFVTLDRVHHSSTTSCILSNRCGGQAPSGCFCDDACTELGDCCFDGPC